MLVDYVRILRPANCLMGAIGVLAGGFLVLGTVNWQVALAMLAAFLITGAGNAINDYADVEADKINKPRRPIPAGRISRNTALIYALLLFGIGIALVLPQMGFKSWYPFALVTFNAGLLIMYSFGLEDKLLLGNLSVSYLTASTFLLGGAAAGNIVVPLLMAVLAFLANTAREIVKDLEDKEGDRASFMKTIVSRARKAVDRFVKKDGRVDMKIGEKWLAIFAGLFLIAAIAFSPVPYMMNVLGIYYLVLLVPTDAFFLWAAHGLAKRGNSSRQFHLISKRIKFGMAFGLLAFIAGAIF